MGLHLSQRKARSHVAQFVCLILLLAVGICFFITLFTISMRYEETAEQYVIDYGYADTTFYGAFNDESAAQLKTQSGVTQAEGRVVTDFREGDITFRAVSLTDTINAPYLYEGRMPETSGECLLLKRNADAMGISTGGVIHVNGSSLTVTGLAAAPEYIYLVQNERTMMANPASFAVVYVTKDFYPAGYNELLVLTDGGFDADAAAKTAGAFRFTHKADQINHILYRNDLEEIETFAYIFPFIFAVLIAAVIVVILSRTVQKDRKQIGTMKALGMPDSKIIGIYLMQFCFASLAGAVVGCFAAMFVTDGIIGIFSSMFEVPALSFKLYPALWIGAVAVAVLLSAVSGLAALASILNMLPANAMRPRVPKGGKRIWLERVKFIWKNLRWGSRYALKNTLRNKGRFFAVVMGMCGSCALLLFSLGFNDSIVNTQDMFFEGFANYDVIVSFDPMPLNAAHPVLDKADDGYKALVMPVTIRGGNYMLAVVDEGFDMVNIPADKLKDVVIIPEYFAEQWDIGAGDTLEIDSGTVTISAVTPQYLGLTLYIGYEYASGIFNDMPPVYNAVYARSGDVTGLTSFLKESGTDYSTLDDDIASFDSIMESMAVLIWFMIACSVVLGFAVLYSVGLINLSAREYEYMFMGVMGCSHRSIMAAHVKETLVQLLLAVPLGFAAGNLLLESIKGEFSGSNFVISAAIYPGSYVMTFVAVVVVTAAMGFVTSRHIGGLDIVEGLKAREE
jgi:putative ABC transport system permease protein